MHRATALRATEDRHRKGQGKLGVSHVGWQGCPHDQTTRVKNSISQGTLPGQLPRRTLYCMSVLLLFWVVFPFCVRGLGSNLAQPARSYGLSL